MTAALLLVATALAGRAALGASRSRRVRARLPTPAVRRMLRAPQAVRRRWHDAGGPLDADLAWAIWVAVAVVGPPLAWLTAGPGAGVLVAGLAAGGPGLAWWATRDRGDRLLERALAPFLEAVARGLRSGASLRMALAEAGGLSGGRLAEEVRAVMAHGPPLVSALEAWARWRPLPGVRLCVAALCLGAEAGGAQAAAVDGVATTLRQRAAAQDEAAALAAQARLSAWLIAAAPLGFGLLTSVADARNAAFLFRTPAGLAVLLAGLALDGAGAVWMVRLTRGRASPAAAVEQELPEVVDLLRLAVGAGLTVPLAVRAVSRRAPGPVGTALARAVEDTTRGRRLADALDDLPTCAGEATRSLAGALAGCERYGHAIGPALERLATECRDRQRRRAEEAARRVPVLLLFPLVLCILPAFALLTVAPLLAGALRALRL
ncbi:MAG TPA: type II secretion system F family protein [Acidimicrobiales bacterium]|nr:type II secretion system F family protein [Acidimicrobiales bacterium]